MTLALNMQVSKENHSSDFSDSLSLRVAQVSESFTKHLNTVTTVSIVPVWAFGRGGGLS